MIYADTSARSSNTAAPTSNLLQAPAYWVGDAMASCDIDKHWQVQLNVYNLFDRKTMASLNNGGSRWRAGRRAQWLHLAEREVLILDNSPLRGRPSFPFLLAPSCCSTCPTS